MIFLIKSKGSPKSFQEASRKLQKKSGRNPEIISLVFLSKQLYQKEILKLTDLYKCYSRTPNFHGKLVPKSITRWQFNPNLYHKIAFCLIELSNLLPWCALIPNYTIIGNSLVLNHIIRRLISSKFCHHNTIYCQLNKLHENLMMMETWDRYGTASVHLRSKNYAWNGSPPSIFTAI